MTSASPSPSGVVHSLFWPLIQSVGLSLWLFGVGGCGGGETSGPAVYPTKGSVMANGRPAFEAVVTLHPVDKSIGVTPSAQVDEEGNFTLTSRKPGDGAPAGDYRITVRWMQQPVPPQSSAPTGVIMSMAGNEGESKAEAKDRLGEVYANPETSGLKCTISTGENEIPTIELDLSKVQAAPSPRQEGA